MIGDKKVASVNNSLQLSYDFIGGIMCLFTVTSHRHKMKMIFIGLKCSAQNGEFHLIPVRNLSATGNFQQAEHYIQPQTPNHFCFNFSSLYNNKRDQSVIACFFN